MAAFKKTKNINILTVLSNKYRPQITSRRNLNLQEFSSKDLLKKYQVTVQDFRVLDSKLDPKNLTNFKADEYVVKAQILAGGRGKGHFDNGFKGGVHLTKNRDEILNLAKNMVGHKLITKQTPKEGILVNKVMVAESVNIVRETYFSIVMERIYNGPALVASPAGGMDIEAVAEKTPHLIKTIPIDIHEGVTDKIATEVADFLEFKGPLRQKCSEEIKKLWHLFKQVDATQLEINPLVETDDGRVVSVDAKINFDDCAKFRQEEIFALGDESETDPQEREAAANNLVYIDLDGSVGCMVNGAGLAMATLDLINLNGGKPANFLDLGGGVGQKQVTAAMKILEADPKVKSIFVDINVIYLKFPFQREAAANNLVYIDLDGSVGCMVNGAGLAMATLDLINLNGGKPANFLDLGGGVGQKQVTAAMKILEADPKVKSIFVNVFAGIINCVTIAKGIIDALKENPSKRPIIMRLEGTNSEPARKILLESKIPMKIITDMNEAAKVAVKHAQ